nr:MAG TPA: hypothetical protein [Caudoviricetes sp.]
MDGVSKRHLLHTPYLTFVTVLRWRTGVGLLRCLYIGYTGMIKVPDGRWL